LPHLSALPATISTGSCKNRCSSAVVPGFLIQSPTPELVLYFLAGKVMRCKCKACSRGFFYFRLLHAYCLCACVRVGSASNEKCLVQLRHVFDFLKLLVCGSNLMFASSGRRTYAHCAVMEKIPCKFRNYLSHVQR